MTAPDRLAVVMREHDCTENLQAFTHARVSCKCGWSEIVGVRDGFAAFEAHVAGLVASVEEPA